MSKFRFKHKQAVGEECPYCLVNTIIVYGDVIYPEREDLHDSRYAMCPKCKAYVGCHKLTSFPLGMVANADLRRLRAVAHKYFDNMWKRKVVGGVRGGKRARSAAYKWLRTEFCIPKCYCHIAMFNEQACEAVIELCRPYYVEQPELKPSEPVTVEPGYGNNKKDRSSIRASGR